MGEPTTKNDWIQEALRLRARVAELEQQLADRDRVIEAVRAAAYHPHSAAERVKEVHKVIDRLPTPPKGGDDDE